MGRPLTQSSIFSTSKNQGARATMKTHGQTNMRIASLSIGAVILFAGCSGATQNLSGSPVGASSYQVQPLTTYSTTVGIKNAWIATIYGSGSATCWSISPGLPSVAGFNTLSAPITLSYTPTCPGPSILPITYGPGPVVTSNNPANCTFNVSYNGTRFVYTVTQGSSTACTAGPSPLSGYDEILTYAQIGPNEKRSFKRDSRL